MTKRQSFSIDPDGRMDYDGDFTEDEVADFLNDVLVESGIAVDVTENLEAVNQQMGGTVPTEKVKEGIQKAIEEKSDNYGRLAVSIICDGSEGRTGFFPHNPALLKDGKKHIHN